MGECIIIRAAAFTALPLREGELVQNGADRPTVYSALRGSVLRHPLNPAVAVLLYCLNVRTRQQGTCEGAEGAEGAEVGGRW